MGSRVAFNTLIPAFVAATLWAGAGLAACRPDLVEVRGPGGQARFAVEVADTDAERAKGLMFRETLPKSAGMLFVYPNPVRASFWMKNTLIPLDMVFADPAGRVTKVHAMAKPHDTTAIDGGAGVLAVLEINGGLAARMGIVPGSELRHPAFGANAVWPCD
jgi:uncharacterized membrane protein (UPF0127 family)